MSNIKLFESKKIRSVWNDAEQKWYFSVQDVVEILTESGDVKQYIKRMLSRDEALKGNWGTICTLVEMKAADGKVRKVQASDKKGLLRIIQSIPSPKAEPLEEKTGKKVVSKDNYLALNQASKKKLKWRIFTIPKGVTK